MMHKGHQEPPFKFDFRDLLATARRKVANQITGITVRLPFLNINVLPNDLEHQVAREIIIRLQDRRVLNSSECCDGCISNALESIQKIRAILVDQEVRLVHSTDGALYFLIEMMLGGIRQFLTFTEQLETNDPLDDRPASKFDRQKLYFLSLDMLRAHLQTSLIQLSELASFRTPRIDSLTKTRTEWQLDAYQSVSTSQP